MLPQINRLKKKKDLERVFRQGRGFREDFLLLKLAPNHLKVSRFGFVVNKKTAGKAVERNKIKRKLRELIRINLSRLKPGFDGIIIVLSKPKNSRFPEAEFIINKLIKKAKLF